VRAVCDKYGVLLILDEVMCGMGRTGTLHACEQEGVVPDLMTIAKGLGGGYQPVGAVLAQRKIVEAMSKGSGFSSTATPTSATRWPAPRRSRCNR
jgi:adenosylmethionine-8-amino-7-oxononanoate aminotransferase